MVTSSTNAPTRSASGHGGRCDDLMSADEFDGEHHECDEQTMVRTACIRWIISYPKNPTAPCTAKHDENSTPERDAEKHGKRFPTEQADQRVPCDRRKPLQCSGKHHPATERHPRIRQLAGSGAWTPRRQVADDQRAHHRPDHHRQQAEPEPQTQHDCQRAGEHAGHVHLRCEPHGEQPRRAAVPLILGNWCDAVRLDRQIAGTDGTVTGESRFGQRTR